MTHSRRSFVSKMALVTFAQSLNHHAFGLAGGDESVNLVPEAPSLHPNYWCTWAVQNYMYGQGQATLDPRRLEGTPGAKLAKGQLREATLFGPKGWLTNFYTKVRSDLYVLLDEGWEEGGYATFIPDGEKFPSLHGTPPEKLKQLNKAVQALGWRGLALWCRDTPGGETDRKLVDWSREAGITYWKIDGGDKTFRVDQVRSQEQVPLITEHVYPEGLLNGDWRKDGRFGPQTWGSPRLEMLRQADVYRTYDTSTTLSIPTTIDRIAELLKASQGHAHVRALLNCEDEVYLAAALGCTMGVMRHPLRGLRPSGDFDIDFAGPRETKQRMDEVVRAVRWQRIAAPYPVSEGYVKVDENVLTDSWFFRRGETWFTESINVLVKQGAPARLARNVDLPKVLDGGEAPFLVAGGFPNGALAIAAQQRTSNQGGCHSPLVDVMWNVGACSGPVGIFGRFRSLTLRTNRPLGKVRVLAQDLATDRSVDITSRVRIADREITFPGDVISQVGLSGATPGDLSDPGLVVQF